jgi:hypothetical protein
MVACDLAKVSVRVRFSLPAPIALIALAVERTLGKGKVTCSNHVESTKQGLDMKLYEATIRTPDGKEFKDRVGANDAQEARLLLQQRHGPRAVPYIPVLKPS